MRNLRFKWVGRYDSDTRQFRFFRVMWEAIDTHGREVSHKLAVSIRRLLPRVTFRRSWGGRFA